MVRDSMRAHLVDRYGAESARIERIEHRLPSDVEVFGDGLPLDSPTLYITLPDAPPGEMPEAIPGAMHPAPAIGRPAIGGPGSIAPGIGAPAAGAPSMDPRDGAAYEAIREPRS